MDFVTFELAKKLKDKGFDWDRITTYNTRTKVRNNHIEPTISQVLKWLREEKKVEIVVSFDYEDKTWGYQVGDMTLTEDSILAYRWNFPTYEQAALAGIEYVLERLSL